MNLYRIWQEVNDGYDAYDSAIVCAKDEEEARNIEVGSSNSWTSPEYVKVEKIGKANKGIEKGIILASFNAG